MFFTPGDNAHQRIRTLHNTSTCVFTAENVDNRGLVLQDILPELREISLVGVVANNAKYKPKLEMFLSQLRYVPQVRCSAFVDADFEEELFGMLSNMNNLMGLRLIFRFRPSLRIARLLQTLPNSIVDLSLGIKCSAEVGVHPYTAHAESRCKTLKKLTRNLRLHDKRGSMSCEVLCHGGKPYVWRNDVARVDFSLPKRIRGVNWMYPAPLNTQDSAKVQARWP